MSAIFVSLNACLTDIESWLQAKMSQVHRCKISYLRSNRNFNQAKLVLGHINDPFQLQY